MSLLNTETFSSKNGDSQPIPSADQVTYAMHELFARGTYSRGSLATVQNAFPRVRTLKCYYDQIIYSYFSLNFKTMLTKHEVSHARFKPRFENVFISAGTSLLKVIPWFYFAQSYCV